MQRNDFASMPPLSALSSALPTPADSYNTIPHKMAGRTRCLGARQPLAIFEALQILWRQCFLARSHAVRHGANVGYWHEAEVSTPVPDVHYEAQSGLQAGLA